jgi:hypothetical protein
VVAQVSFDWFEYRVQSLELDSCIVSRELPIHSNLFFVSITRPRSNFGRERFHVGYSLIEALSTKNAQFNFRHVEPTSVFWSVMNLQLVEDATSFLWSKCFVQRGGFVSIQVVVNQNNFGSSDYLGGSDFEFD